MQRNVNSIVQILADFEEQIEFLLLTDANFRELCKDYMICASAALESKKEKDKSQEKIAEYEVVQLNLEQEILKFISKTRLTK